MPDIGQLSWSSNLSKPGKLIFSVIGKSNKATRENLQKLNRVEVVRNNSEILWNGYINTPLLGDEEHLITCESLLGLFDFQLLGNEGEQTKTVNETASWLLSQVNSVCDTYIDEGLINASIISITDTYERPNILKAWQKLAKTGGYEFEIDEERKFNFDTQIGEDKSNSIILRYNTDIISANNIFDGYKIIDSVNEYANRVVGKSKQVGGSDLIVEKINTTEQSLRGRISYFKDFGDGIDTPTLTMLTEQELENRINNIRIDDIEIMVDKIDFSQIKCGDIIKARIKNEQYDINENYKIASIKVKIDENINEQVILQLINPDRNEAPPSMSIDPTNPGLDNPYDEYVNSILERVNNLEKRI